MQAKYRVLITDGFWRKSLAAVRSLGRAGHWVAVGERTSFAPGLYSRFCDQRFVYPDPIRETSRFLDSLAERIRKHRIQILLPMEEETLLVILRGRDRLPAGCRIPFAPASKIEEVRDKGRLGRLAADAGVPTPRTAQPRNLADLEAAARSLGWPIVVKPRIGTGARGIAYTKTIEELLPAWRAASRPGLPALLQERLPQEGVGVGVSVLCAPGGEVMAHFTHRRV
ncbi:MAG: hypothetical protein O7H41_13800, partial [Planctomycetota bacterium]|nr:hypothetical protein [Planctomycetota bacterium]